MPFLVFQRDYLRSTHRGSFAVHFGIIPVLGIICSAVHISIDYNHITRKPSFAEVAQDREAWRLLENADSL